MFYKNKIAVLTAAVLVLQLFTPAKKTLTYLLAIGIVLTQWI